ncbi:permease [candidate division KSB1 bacterium]|nr:permease [candidate division KSB1 bacterium]
MLDLWWKFYSVWEKTLSFRIFVGFFELLWLVLPYFLLGLLVILLFDRFLPKLTQVSALKKNTIGAIIFASVLGVLSPLGTYVAVPICAILLRNGYPMAPIFAFMLATPLINPNLFILTAGMLGLPMAVARTVSAFILGIAAGIIIYFFPVSIDKLSEHKKNHRRKENFWRHFFSHIKYVLKFFLIALFISSVVQVVVPSEWIVQTMGSRGGLSVFVAVGLGVPFYSCGGAAIPLIMVLKDLGMASGPILAFFISGPATKFSTLAVIKMTMGWRVFFFYLSVSMIGAVFFGLIYGWLG